MIAITIGDANGVGLDITLTAFRRQGTPDDAVVIGNSTAIGFFGHTEFVAGICGTTDHTTMLASPKLVVTHASAQVALTKAIKQVRCVFR
jgi:4-hydroxy-L-threonine phosphate dehydrogenase PdxA